MVRENGEFYEEIREIRQIRILMSPESLNPIFSVFPTGGGNGTGEFPDGETVNPPARMREDGQEDVIPRLSVPAKRYEVLENLVHESHFFGIEDVFLATQSYGNPLGKQEFSEVFEGFVFLGDYGDFVRRNLSPLIPEISRHTSSPDPFP